MEQWIDAQPQEIRFVFEFIRRNLTHISQKRFEGELKKSFQLFLDENPRRKPLLFLLHTRPKQPRSPVWVTALIRQFFHETVSEAQYVSIPCSNVEPAASDLKKLGQEEYEVVIVDDGAYQGIYLEGFLTGWISRALNYSNGAKGTDYKFPNRIHVVCPFMTTQARTALSKYPFVKIYSTYKIQTIGELLEDLPAEERAKYTPEIIQSGNVPLLPTSGTLTYFDHKTPDSISLLQAVTYGIVFQKMPYGGYEPALEKEPSPTAILYVPNQRAHPNVPFLETGREPYKN